jgi:predicted RNase H-like HicB family nuclease
MNYKLLVSIAPLKEGGYLARCEEVRANATGDTSEEAIRNLRETIDEMISEYGREAVFQDVNFEGEVRIIEVAV